MLEYIQIMAYINANSILQGQAWKDYARNEKYRKLIADVAKKTGKRPEELVIFDGVTSDRIRMLHPLIAENLSNWVRKVPGSLEYKISSGDRKDSPSSEVKLQIEQKADAESHGVISNRELVQSQKAELGDREAKLHAEIALSKEREEKLHTENIALKDHEKKLQDNEAKLLLKIEKLTEQFDTLRGKTFTLACMLDARIDLSRSSRGYVKEILKEVIPVQREMTPEDAERRKTLAAADERLDSQCRAVLEEAESLGPQRKSILADIEAQRRADSAEYRSPRLVEDRSHSPIE